jgi:hypothetical protein
MLMMATVLMSATTTAGPTATASLTLHRKFTMLVVVH